MTVGVLGYGRMSTSQQVISPEVQREQCEDWFEMQMRRGEWNGDAKWIDMKIDYAVSGKVPLFERPCGQHILTELDRGDVLVVAKDSRAFRSPGDAERTIDMLNSAGIRLVILNLNVDTSTPSGMLMVSMFAAFARFERELIAERTRDAIDRRMRDGIWLGNPPPGWKRRRVHRTHIETSELVPNPIVRDLGRYAASELAKGRKLEAIAFEINRHVPPNAYERSTRSKGRRFSRRLILSWAVYYVCDWPPVTRRRLEQMVECDPRSIAFVRDRYVEPANPEELSKGASGKQGIYSIS